MPHPAPPPPASPELQAWLDKRHSLIKLKIKFRERGDHITLSDDALDPELLPEPLRSEAIEYLRPIE